MSLDGRYVAFTSTASNLVPGDTDGVADVFVHDNETGTTERVSVATGGAQANAESGAPSISYDGRYVAFESYATNLVAGDTNGHRDVFLRDRQAGTTIRVSVATDGTQANGESRYPSISADGKRVAFQSTATNLAGTLGHTGIFVNVFVRDWTIPVTGLVSAAGCLPTGDTIEGNGASTRPALSGDGNWVAFESLATNFYSGDTNGSSDVFVAPAIQSCNAWSVQLMDSPTDPPNGCSWYGSAATISYDGRYVGFTGITCAPQYGSNDVRIDRDTNTVAWTLVTAYQTGIGRLTMSTDGSRFGHGYYDYYLGADTYYGFVYDLSSVYGGGTVDDSHRTLVSTNPTLSPVELDPTSSTVLSPDGQYAAWVRNDGQVMVRYIATITVTSVSPGTIARGTSGTLAVEGTGFTAGVTARASNSSLALGSPTVIGTTLALVPYTVPANATPGATQILIVAPPTWSATATAVGACNCLTVS